MTLAELASALESVALDAPLTAADRAYLCATAARVRGMDAHPVTPPTAEPDGGKAGSGAGQTPRTCTRTEAARRARVAPNTLLRWEARGLLTPARDAKGWRVYSRADVERARALGRREPVPPDLTHDGGTIRPEGG